MGWLGLEVDTCCLLDTNKNSQVDHTLWVVFKEDCQLCLSGEVRRGTVRNQNGYPVQFLK